MFPYIGPEFIAALMDRPAKKTNSAFTHRAAKRHATAPTTPSPRAFWVRQMRALKVSTIPARLFQARKGGAGSNSSLKHPSAGGMGVIKCTSFIRRRPGLTHEQFVAHYREVHAPLFAALPATRKYVLRYIQNHPIAGQVPGFQSSTIDGVSEIWFDDLTKCHALFRDAEYLEIIRPDEERFIDTINSEMLLTVENRVIPYWQAAIPHSGSM
jgi:uncharacterized protein (TIGR02118 family)